MTKVKQAGKKSSADGESATTALDIRFQMTRAIRVNDAKPVNQWRGRSELLFRHLQKVHYII
ncbi:MAG: hypothetical protein GY765_03985 [bacterium]|nr:hypothetical protein [bacterium]